MSSDIENQQKNNQQDKLTSDISFELEQAKKKLQADEKLTYLNLSNHTIGNSGGIKLLSKALKNSETVTYLNLHNSIVKYTELGDKEHKDSSYNQLIISISFPPDSMYLTIILTMREQR
jgi:hypothetical protein